MSALSVNSQIQRRAINLVPLVMTLLGVIVASFVVVIIGIAFGVHGPDVYCLLWAALAIIVGCVPIAFDMGRPRSERHVFLSMLAIMYTIGYVMPVFVHYIPAVGPMDPPAMGSTGVLPRDIALGQAVAILGILSLYVGYTLPIRSVVRSVLPMRGHEWKLGASIIATCLFVFVGWFVFLGRSFGLIPSSLGSGLLGGIANSTLFASSLLMATYLKYRSRVALLLLAFIVPVSMFINFMTGSKKLALMPAVMVVLTWVIVERRIRLRWAFAGFLAIVLIYPVAQFWRSDILQENTLTIGDVLLNPGPALSHTSRFLSSGRASDYLSTGIDATSSRLDAIGVTSVIIRDTPSVSPFQNGRTLALIPIAYIPRIFWPGKPIITIGQWVTEAYVPYGNLVDSSLGSTWVGEFYLNRGIPVVVVGMMVMGLLLRFAHESLMRPRATIPIVTAAVIVMSTAPLALQGGVVMAINPPILTMIPLVMVHITMRLLGGTRLVALEDESVDAGTA